MTRLLTTTAISGGVLLALSAPVSAQTPLPPIEVRSPKAFELGQIKVGERRLGLPTKVAAPAGPGGVGAGAGAPPPTWSPSEKIDNGPTPQQHTDAFGGYTITNRQMETFARPTLDSAVNIAPGVDSQIASGAGGGGARNEPNIYVRGFDRWQVPLTVDGVRVYLPVDNRLDFARFLTADVAEVQIAKGYVSVLDGPGGMGGQINLVTRRPTREIEAEWRTRFEFGRDGTFLGPMTYGFAGTKHDLWYAQLSGTFQNYDGWMLPASYRSTLAQGPGMRGQSATQDYNVNARVAVTPNATDEYSLSFTRQEGQKGSPLHTTDPLTGSGSQKFWRWPYWRLQNLYFLSRTQLNDAAYVKTRGYWSKYDNSLVSYDDPSFINQSLPKSFNSAYADYALGAEVEAGTQIGDIDTLKALFFYRMDNHSEWQENFGQNIRGTRAGCVAGVPCYTQPIIGDIEDTYSAAVENTFHPRQDIDIVSGFSYDWRHLRQAQGFALPQGVINYQPTDVQAPNYQGAAIWRYTDTDRIYFNGSSRTRYPTLFERFSTRFGGATSNPTLMPERATNFDLGWSSLFAPGSRVSVDVFYSLVDNLIQSVPAPQFGANVTQSQNVGSGRFYGAEISADYFVREDFSLGGNVTLMRRRVNSPSILNFQPTGVPDFKMFLYAGYRPIPQLTLTPSLEVAGARWTTITNGNWYYRTGAYCLTNFNADYTPGDNIKFSAGVRNAFDDYYVLADGYPSPGRTFYLASKVNF